MHNSSTVLSCFLISIICLEWGHLRELNLTEVRVLTSMKMDEINSRSHDRIFCDEIRFKMGNKYQVTMSSEESALSRVQSSDDATCALNCGLLCLTSGKAQAMTWPAGST